jgi:UDP-N-acetylmuramoyl-tripeptide--D-alanyl-D-alanine ligase
VEPVPSDLNLKLTASYYHHTYNINTNLFGSYNLENVKAAIATGLFLGVEMEDIVDAVQKYSPANNRSQIKITKNNTLICDSYNANPTSMNSALESFSGIQTNDKTLILGDMLELGERSEEEHIKLLEVIQSYVFGKVFLVGPVFKKIAVNSGFKAFNSIEGLIDFLNHTPVKGNTILIKGSRGIGLEKAYDML